MPQRSLDPQMLSSFRVTMPNFPNIFFTKFSGIKGTSPVTSFANGFSQTKQKKVGMVAYDNVTISKPFDPKTDAPLINLLKDYCEGEDGRLMSVTVTPVTVCRNIERKGSITFTLLGCRPVSVKVAETDSDSVDGISMLEIELTVDDVKY